MTSRRSSVTWQPLLNWMACVPGARSLSTSGFDTASGETPSCDGRLGVRRPGRPGRRLALRRAVHDHLDVGRRRQQEDGRRRALHRERQLLRLPSGDRDHLLDGLVPEPRRLHREIAGLDGHPGRRGRHGHPVHLDDGVGGIDRERERADGRRLHLVEQRHDARRDLRRERERGVDRRAATWKSADGAVAIARGRSARGRGSS